MSLAVYEFASQLQQLFSARDVAESQEETDAIDQAIAECFTAIDKKVDGYAEFFSRSDAEIERLAEEIKFLQSRKKTLESRAEWMDQKLLTFMQHAGTPELKGEIHKLMIRKNPPAVVITDEGKIPGRFIDVAVTRTIRKADISTALKAKEEVPGAELRAGERLEVK